ncbi:restriction endonuclease [Streptomyces microflavus]|uniref:restriction endonuclease n=1 Tax=Streptomyces microflavus TaxID=1919 RepID=UPI0033AB0A28
MGSRDLQTFKRTVRSEHGADVPLFVASCVFTKPARAFAAKHQLSLVDIDLLGFWNSWHAAAQALGPGHRPLRHQQETSNGQLGARRTHEPRPSGVTSRDGRRSGSRPVVRNVDVGGARLSGTE